MVVKGSCQPGSEHRLNQGGAGAPQGSRQGRSQLLTSGGPGGSHPHALQTDKPVSTMCVSRPENRFHGAAPIQACRKSARSLHKVLPTHLSQRHPVNRRRSYLGERLCRLAVAAERQTERWGHFICGRKSVRCRRWQASSSAWLFSCAAALPLHEKPAAAPGRDALTSQLHLQNGIRLTARTKEDNGAAAISPPDPATVSKGERQLVRATD